MNPLDLLGFVVRGPRSMAEMGREGTVAHHCHAPGCGKSTREGKPYCSEHVDHQPYVQQLIDQLAEHEQKVAKIKAGKTRVAKADDLVAKEIVLQLREHGARTLERLARDLREDTVTITAYVHALKRKRQVSLGASKRGNTTVRLAG
jgi:hypothetical protein